MRIFWALLPALLLGQSAKPPAGTGKAIYLSNCSFCHGASGEGGRGPNLSSGTPVHGTAEADYRRVISKGIAGTPMPSFQFEPEEMKALTGHLRSLREGSAAPEKAAGDAAKGKDLYAKLRCAACHRIDREGSVYGPDLTRVGAGRSLSYLRESLVNPSADVPVAYRGVAVTTAEGNRVTGIRINEDNFSIQLRNIAQQFVMFQKAEVKEVSELKNSVMPPYATLAKPELEDLVAYLGSLKGGSRSTAVKKAEGVR